MRRSTTAAVFLAAACVLVCIGAADGVPFDPEHVSRGPEAEAMAHLQAGQPARAIEVLKAALVKDPDSPGLHYYLGLAYLQSAKFDLAEAEFRTVLREDEDFVEAHVRLANLARRKVSAERSDEDNLRAMEAAIRQLEQALPKNPYDIKLYYNVADAWLTSARYRGDDAGPACERALAVLNEAKARQPDAFQPLLALGQARRHYAVLLAGDTPLAELEGPKAQRCNALLDEAIADFRAALELAPGPLSILEEIAKIESSRGRLDAALKAFEDHVPKLESTLDKATCYRSMGQFLLVHGDLGAAEAKFNTAIQTDANDLVSYLFLSDLLARRGDVDAAADTLAKAVKTNPHFLNAQVELARLERGRGDIVTAILHYTAALNIPLEKAVATGVAGERTLRQVGRTLYTQAAAELGDLLIRGGQHNEAIAVFQRLAAILPGSPEPEFRIGEVRRLQGDLRAARDHYGNALRRDPNYVRARTAIAELSAREARLATTDDARTAAYRQALAHYEQALRTAPREAGIHNRTARLLVGLAQVRTPADRAVLEQALARARTAVELAPNAPAFRRHVAEIQRELGRDTEAVAELEAAIEGARAQVEQRPEDVRLVLELADFRSRLHQWTSDATVLTAAVADFERAAKQDPSGFRAYGGAAALFVRMGNHAKAAEWLERYLETVGEPEDPTKLTRSGGFFFASAELAWIYCEHLDDLDRARKYAARAAEIDPNVPSLLDTLGWIHHKAGEHERAIPLLRRAFKNAPTNAVIGYHLGATLAKVNNPKRAEEVLADALKHAGDEELRDKIQAVLRTVRD